MNVGELKNMLHACCVCGNDDGRLYKMRDFQLPYLWTLVLHAKSWYCSLLIIEWASPLHHWAFLRHTLILYKYCYTLTLDPHFI